MVTIVNTLTFTTGGLLGCLIGYYINHRLARARSLEIANISEFNKAAVKLREAFWPEYLALTPQHYVLQTELVEFLENSFYKHKTAIFEFAHYLPVKSKTAFLEVWYEYYCHPDARNENSVPHFGQYSCRGLTYNQEREMKLLVQSRIDKVLAFSKPN